MEDQKIRLLKYWEKLEFLNPASLPKNKRILNQNSLPWNDSKNMEYEVYLAVFTSSTLFDFIRLTLESDEKDPNEPKDNYISASLKINPKGTYIADSFQLSMLPFALDKLSKKSSEKDWDEAFEKKKTKLKEVVTSILTNETGSTIILNSTILEQLNNYINSCFEWNKGNTNEIYYCSTPVFNFKKKDESAIVNSNFTKDLKLIISNIEKSYESLTLEKYLLGALGIKNQIQTDLNLEIKILEESLTVTNYPDGCWPSNYTLSLMQQFAVNHVINNLSIEGPKEPLFSVNGPPGTGKTTLLRDIIAANIVKKAKVQSEIKDPKKVFSSKEELSSWDNKTKYPYWPISKEYEYLKDFGMLITSSNNGAVENVTKELPQKKAIEGFEAQYFTKFAEEYSNGENWGLVAAVLGNSENINTFCDSIKEPEKGLLKYLEENRLVDDSVWIETVFRFNEKLKEVENEKKSISSLIDLVNENIKKKKDRVLAQKTHDNYEFDILKLLKKIKSNNSLLSLKLSEINELEMSRPRFWSRLFKTQKYRSYLGKFRLINHNIKSITHEIDVDERNLKKNELDKLALLEKLSSLNKKIEQLSENIINDSRSEEDNFVKEDFWDTKNNNVSQQRCPWYFKTLKKLQSELFICSLRVNEIFIHTANGTDNHPISNNIKLFTYLQDRNVSIKTNYHQSSEIWHNLFLIVPVLSGTFASIQNMLSQHVQNTIPWLFVDEAGQALPQMAAGAMWRAKRAVVVGDPLQIEPVNTMPSIIGYHLAKYFDLKADSFHQIDSVQKISDYRNQFGANIKSGSKMQWVGTPLKVHRRCLSPMFDISNSIAYDNSMVLATKKETSFLLLETQFIHIEGKVVGRHYVHEQGEIILSLISKEINLNQTLPDIYIISPFSEVAKEINKLLSEKLPQQFPYLSVNVLNDWLKKSIGTVHTFQGKEAEAVILCLGCDKTKMSAINWAASKPNILNVAVTRAKYKFVAVGDKNLWLNQPFFKELSKLDLIFNS